MVGEDLRYSEKAKNLSNHLPLLEKIEICRSEMAENVSNHPTWLEKIRFIFLK